MRGPPGTSLYSGYPLATIRITPPIKNASPDVQFLAQFANALAFLPFAAVCPYFYVSQNWGAPHFVRVLCATVRDFSAATMHLNPGKGLKTNKRDSGFECSVTPVSRRTT